MCSVAAELQFCTLSNSKTEAYNIIFVCRKIILITLITLPDVLNIMFFVLFFFPVPFF